MRQAANTKDLAKALIEHHEGRRTHPYTDTTGHLTIGIGPNLSARGLSADEIDLLFDNDLNMARRALRAFLPGWVAPSAVVRAALLSMAFNLGQPRLMGFVRMRSALLAGDYAAAADEALDSRWTRQTGHRAHDIAGILRLSAPHHPPLPLPKTDQEGTR